MRTLSLIALLLACGALSAQGSCTDYARMEQMKELAAKGLGRVPAAPVWLEDGSAFLYREDNPEGRRQWWLIQAKDGRRERPFDASKLAAALQDALKRPVDPEKLPIEAVSLKKAALHFRTEDRWWSFALKGHTLAPALPPRTKPERNPFDDEPPFQAPGPVKSPDGRFTAVVDASNVVVRNLAGQEVLRTQDGTSEHPYTGAFDWSPDGLRLVAQRATVVPIRKVTLVESSPKDQLQPRTHTIDYAKPGDPLPIVTPVLLDVDGRKVHPATRELAPNPYLEPGQRLDIHWAKDSSAFFWNYNQRGHQVFRVLSVDVRTGATRAVVEETSKTFIDYSGKHFEEYLDETHEIVWMSEREGWNHLYRLDTRTGQVLNPITRGPWVVRRVLHVDTKRREVFFLAGGIVPGQDPYFTHLAKANLDGGGLKVLTEGDGSHSVTLNADRTHFVDVWSRVDLPPVMELRRVSDGARIAEVGRADAAELAKGGWRTPERFVAKGRDGVTDIHGVIYRPSNYDPAKKYPVLEYIYAGPHDAFAPKTFQHRANFWEMTELGFIVVALDGMGTSQRSKAFQDVCWQNIGDAGFPDRVAWIKAAAAKDPAMDITRVGIYGTSAGGQDALRGLLAHGDFYKAGVADCGCHDNRMDKIWWNEQWMGWPIGPHYAQQSNVVNAPKLTGKLLLLVGEMDTNVDPASTMQVVDALVKADKDFEMLVVPGAGHGVVRVPHVRRRLMDFFVRNLLHVEPRHQ